MTPLESILYMIWRGIAIGVLISAPMGPVGILCIQRTLDKGRHAGFYTGIGAAISDLFYCLLTGFGLSFIEDFIESNQNVIQLAGSVVLIAFSIYLFRKDPASPLRRPMPQNVSAKKNILGGFLFTFSNPLIIFLIIGLFARFNFTSPDIAAPYVAIGYIFIAAGALGWWFGITHAINKVRSRFNMRSMKIMNCAIGVVILIFACVGIVSSIIGLTSHKASAAGPTHYMFVPVSSGSTADTIPRGSEMRLCDGYAAIRQIDLKVTPTGERAHLAGSRGNPWSIHLYSADGDTLTLTMNVTENAADPLTSQPALICDASRTGGISLYRSRPVCDRLALPSGWNHFRLTTDQEGTLTLLAGERELTEIMRFTDRIAASHNFTSASLKSGATPLLIRDIRIACDQESPMSTPADIGEVMERVRLSNDPMEGIWEIFDWKVNTDLARQGGEYRLAIIRRPDRNYDIIYLTGAEILPERWKPGMMKGRLEQTGIPFLYRLIWIDSEGEMMSRQLRAQGLPLQSVITLDFPFLETTLRLRKRGLDLEL